MPDCPECGHRNEAQSGHCTQCGAETAGRDHTVTSPPRAAETRRGTQLSVHGRFEPGTRLGTRYRIVGLLGRGGMGEVYRADDLELGQSVALKFLPTRVAGDPAALDRFRNEVRTARQIAHPNVCRIYDISEADGHVFLSMEYIDGEDLAGVLRRLGRPSPEKAIEIARQICLGLAAAHENSVLHRDLKPANIMIDGRGRVRITDFGLAGFVDELERSAVLAGTPAYMAPEQLSNGNVSARSDIYTLGLILFELFTGKRVFKTTDIEALKNMHHSSTVATPSSISEEIDPAVERVIMRCLEQQPEHRPQSAYQVLAALPGGDPLAAALAAGETPSPELVANARDTGGLHPPAALGLLAAMLAMLAVLYFYSTSTTVMPQRTPEVLSVVAEQTMQELGYVDLPRNSVAGYESNPVLAASLQRSPRPHAEIDALSWPPRFYYWRRWSDGQFIPTNFHFPEEFTFDSPVINSDQTATVAFDSTGRLLALRATWPRPQDEEPSTGEADWSPLFQLSRLDQERAIRVPLSRPTPISCDDAVAWQIETDEPAGSSLVVQMGALGGLPNYFEILDCLHMMSEVPRPYMMELMWLVFELLIIVLAVRNLRAGRGDRRNAFRCAVLMGVLYAMLEVLALRHVETGLLLQLRELQGGRAAGHIILHALNVWLIYMAVEPYVRRFWPRMLVGGVRLLSGRLRDPAVGREILIGIVSGCGLVVGVALLSWVDRLQLDSTGQLPSRATLMSMISPGRFITSQMHYVAWAMLDAAYCAGYLIVLRFITRRPRAALALAVVLIGAGAGDWFLQDVSESIWAAVVYGAVFGIALILLYTRVGVVAAGLAFYAMRSSSAITIDFGSPFAIYGYAEFAIWMAIAAYGFWVALAGQPIFKDMLAEPQGQG